MYAQSVVFFGQSFARFRLDIPTPNQRARALAITYSTTRLVMFTLRYFTCTELWADLPRRLHTKTARAGRWPLHTAAPRLLRSNAGFSGPAVSARALPSE